MRDALSTLDQLAAAGSVTVQDAARLLGSSTGDLMFEFADALATGDIGAAVQRIAQLVEEGHDLRVFARQVVEHLRALLLTKQVAEPGDLIDATDETRARLAAQADGFSGAKLLPILFFVAMGLFFVDWHRLDVAPPKPGFQAVTAGGFAALFACTGFEYVPVTAGETDNPRRNVPLALFFALLGSVLLYVLVQLVFMGTHPSPATADKPLAEAASAFAGPWAGQEN